MIAYSSFRLLLIAAFAALPGVALAQVDYSAGKTPEQLFASDCSACHQAPQGLGRGRDARNLTNFLREHYTTKTQWATVLANYLVRVRDLPPPPPPAPAAPVQTGSAEPAKPTESVASPPEPAAKPLETAAKPSEPAAKPPELPTKPTVQTLQSKLRNYARAGEKATPAE